MKLTKVFLLFFLLVLASTANSVELKKGQRLACGAILCAVGIAIPASHSECRKALLDWSVYLATLGPFRSKPKCPIIASNQAVSYSTMTCSSIVDPEFRSMCDNANDTKPQPGYHRCDTIVDGYQRFECENSCDSKYKDRDGNLVCLVE